MINIIKSDLYRIFRGKGIYIAFAILVAMIAMSIYNISPGIVGQMSIGEVETAPYAEDDPLNNMTYEQIQSMSMKEYRKVMLETEGYELDKSILSANMNLYYILIFVAALAVTVDFSGGCIKNTLSSAISRKKYFLSKNVLILGMCMLIFFLNTYIVYFSNIIFNSKNLSSSLWEVTRISLLQLPPIIALASILSGVAFITKKTAAYNMVTIPMVMVFQALFMSAIAIFNIDKKCFNYEFQVMIGKLAGEPSDSYILKSYILCGVVIVVSYFVGWISFKKSDIK